MIYDSDNDMIYFDSCLNGFPRRSLVVVLPLVLEVSVKSSL